MNNPNESILLTEDGHPIGDVVIADNSSYAAHPPPDATVSEVRNTLLKSIASELTHELDGDVAVAELYPQYTDAELRKVAMTAYVT